MKLCYIGRVPTNWWPRRVLCALWTRRPIVKVAMGCRTEPAAVHIAHVLQRLDFFQFFNFFYNLHDLPQKKKLHDLPQKLKNSIFFYNSHDLQQKKNYTHLQQKKIYTTIRFFCTRLTFFTPPSPGPPPPLPPPLKQRPGGGGSGGTSAIRAPIWGVLVAAGACWCWLCREYPAPRLCDGAEVLCRQRTGHRPLTGRLLRCAAVGSPTARPPAPMTANPSP